MNTPKPTPTPRTDAAWSSAFNAEDFSASSVARSMQVFSQKIEIELAALTAERDQLRADRTYNHECINRLAVATGTLGEKSEKVVDVVLSTIDQLRAENVTLRGAQKACEACDEPTAFEVRQLRARAELAEVELIAEQGVRTWASAQLATERARLDSGQILLTVAGERVWHSGVDLRAAIDAAMKEEGSK